MWFLYILAVVCLALHLTVEYKDEALKKRAVQLSLERDYGMRFVKRQSKLRKGFRGLARFLKERRNERAN